MSNVSSQIWLHKLFNSKYFDTWMAVSYLHRYPCLGIHQYICNKLDNRDDIELVLPQIIHIMFYHTSHAISFPIYNLLKKKGKNKKFALALFFHLKSFLKILNNEKLNFCKSLISELIEEHRKKDILKLDRLKNTTYFNHKTKMIENNNQDYLCLEGLLIYFVKSVSWNVSSRLTRKLNEYEDIFRLKGATSLVLEGEMRNSSDFKNNFLFLTELVQITLRLKQLPKSAQQISLEVELEQLRQVLPAKIFLPFNSDKYLCNILIEDSYVLDSAKNSPYTLVCELANEVIQVKRETTTNILTAGFLLNLLKSPTQKNKAIKEGIIEKLSQLTNKKEINEPWEDKKNRITENSIFKDLKGHEVVSLIIKSGNDFKQELIAYQLLTEIKRIFEEENKEIWIKNYQIYLVGNSSGLVETITKMKSIHHIKKMNMDRKGYTLLDYYKENFEDLTKAKRNFLKSLVGYSLITYFLQLKDRHNGNILIDDEGHIIHVDFGFILGDHPGFYNVEKAPFKFSSEYFELLDFSLEEFKRIFLDSFLSLRKYSDRLCRIVEMLIQNSQLKCVNKHSVADFKNRFKLDLCNQTIDKYIIELIDLAFKSRSTGIYDQFQYFSNGYL